MFLRTFRPLRGRDRDNRPRIEGGCKNGCRRVGDLKDCGAREWTRSLRRRQGIAWVGGRRRRGRDAVRSSDSAGLSQHRCGR